LNHNIRSKVNQSFRLFKIQFHGIVESTKIGIKQEATPLILLAIADVNLQHFAHRVEVIVYQRVMQRS
jgi:hypothetical protein